MKHKHKQIQIRTTEEVHAEAFAAAVVRGTSLSSILHQFLVSFIRQARTEHPEEFANALKSVLADRASSADFTDKPVIDTRNDPDFRPESEGLVLDVDVLKTS